MTTIYTWHPQAIDKDHHLLWWSLINEIRKESEVSGCCRILCKHSPLSGFFAQLRFVTKAPGFHRSWTSSARSATKTKATWNSCGITTADGIQFLEAGVRASWKQALGTGPFSILSTKKDRWGRRSVAAFHDWVTDPPDQRAFKN